MVTKGLPLGQFEIKILIVPGHSDINTTYFISSSEAQGQIVGARESLNGRENVARRKVKNGEKSVPYIYFRPFRLSLAPFICPWVSEDDFICIIRKSKIEPAII